MYPEPIPLEIVHEDEQIVVLLKPSGMLVHPTIGVKTGTLANALAYHLNKRMIEEGEWPDPRSSTPNSQRSVRPGLVHRLDRATSGLMVIAKTPRSLTTLSRHFRRRLVEKRYVALVWGDVELDAGTIDAPIGRDPDGRPRWRVMEGGKGSETRFRVLERRRAATLLELEPVTGRTNQLRIHCARIGHPIVGDGLYCESPITGCGMRLCLHASRLAFHHPATGEWLEFTSPLPDGIVAVAGRLAGK
ncbi:MAG TPA: RluA family pseudouridine synthase, partial [Blastocatellia bacterium]|nr:RluA family pseudouridine synthase [Blastocatellia bacterium]